jgi:hypothetical protein
MERDFGVQKMGNNHMKGNGGLGKLRDMACWFNRIKIVMRGNSERV